MTDFVYPQIGNTPSTQPLAGVFNIDQMPPLTFQNGSSIGNAVSVFYTAAANTTGFTATPAQIVTGQDNTLNLTGTLVANANIQLPTPAAISNFLPNNEVVGQGFNLRIINSSSGAFTWTVTTNTGWTLAGTMTIAQNTWRDFYVIVTAASNGIATAITLQSIGTGTQS